MTKRLYKIRNRSTVALKEKKISGRDGTVLTEAFVLGGIDKKDISTRHGRAKDSRTGREGTQRVNRLRFDYSFQQSTGIKGGKH